MAIHHQHIFKETIDRMVKEMMETIDRDILTNLYTQTPHQLPSDFYQKPIYRYHRQEGGAMASRIKDVETAGIEMELHTAVCNCFRWEGHGQNVRWIKQVNDGDPRKEDGVGLIFIFDKDGLPIRTLEVFPGDWVCCHPVDEIIMVMSDEEFSVMFRRHGVGEHSRAEAIETMHSMQKLAFMLIQKYGNVQNDDKGRPFHMVEIDEEMERSLNGETAKLVIEKSFEKMATLVCAVGGRK